MRIALAHFRTGKTDGVSLEMDKWRQVLEEMGHQVYYISGSRGAEIYIEELFYRHPRNLQFVDNAYRQFKNYSSQKLFQRDLEDFARRIEGKLIKGLRQHDIELLVPNNILSLGWNLPAALAFYRVIKKFSLPVIAHHHDFYWERSLYQNPTCQLVEEILEGLFPPQHKLIDHVVINRLASRELKKRTGLEATVVPNVFDFDQPAWKTDEYNRDLRSKLGIRDSDIVILQATRIAKRKAIELAIEFTGRLQDRREELEGRLYDGRNFTKKDRLVFLIPGLVEAEKGYTNYLQQVADSYSLELIWASDLFAHNRQQDQYGKVYSLWDSYVIADMITYTSIKEGWGNQLLEGLFARKPLLIYEYPVYVSDIRDKGLKVASLGQGYWTGDRGFIHIPEERFQEPLARPLTFSETGTTDRG